ncbi:MAG: terminase small subunit, partial [Acidobacteria bacterium]|nr:terminase small subunit [Acidobacteriota bacterium]
MSDSKKPDGRKISRKLNLKQRHFVAEFTDPKSKGFGNQTKAAELAGYSKEHAGNQAYRLTRNDDVRSEIERIMDEAGVTRKKVAQRLNEGLDAKITRVFCPTGGALVYSKGMVDHPTRVRTAELVSKLRGDFPATKTTLDVQGLGNLGIEIIAEGRKRASERHEADGR